MEDYVKKLIRIANEHFGKNITELKEIDFTIDFNLNRFQQHLFDFKAVPFLQLRVIDSLKPSDAFLMGTRKVVYEDRYSEDIPDNQVTVKEYGPSVIKKEFSRNEIFDFILENLGLSGVRVEMDFGTYSEESKIYDRERQGKDWTMSPDKAGENLVEIRDEHFIS